MSAPDSELSVDQRNALQEIANIGMGQAGASIAKIWFIAPYRGTQP